MRRTAVAIVVCLSACFTSIARAQRETPLSPDTIRAEAAGCVVSVISCGGSDSGEIAAGDCAFSNGHRYDLWGFNGVAGQLVTVTLTATDASFVEPSVQLVPPVGDASQAPIIVGDPNVPIALKYKLATSGAWGIVVSTGALTAGGKYQISVSCGAGDSTTPQGCVTQQLACGQVLGYVLGATSCTFSGGGLPYSYSTVSLVKGDYVEFDANSAAFDPTLSIYRNGGSPIANGFGKRSGAPATVFFTAPATDNYQAAVYTMPTAVAGSFTLAYSCINVCSAPTITSQPVSQTVSYGGTAVLSVGASSPNGNAPSFTWFQDDGSLPVSIASGASFTVPNVTSVRRYYAQAQNACGFVNSAAAVITPKPPPRGRAVRH